MSGKVLALIIVLITIDVISIEEVGAHYLPQWAYHTQAWHEIMHQVNQIRTVLFQKCASGQRITSRQVGRVLAKCFKPVCLKSQIFAPPTDVMFLNRIIFNCFNRTNANICLLGNEVSIFQCMERVSPLASLAVLFEQEPNLFVGLFTQFTVHCAHALQSI